MTDVITENKSLWQDKNLRIIFGVTLMAVMGVSSITPAFPTIIEKFDITPGHVGLLITFFTLPGVFLAPVMGIMADRFGRKRILVPSLFLFGLAGFAGTFTTNFNLLLGFRVLQGIGASSLGSLNTTVIGDLFSGPRRAKAMGFNASVLSLGTASYPSIGGALALIGWNYPFVLPILAIPIGIIVLFFLKSPEPETHQNLKEYLAGTWHHIKDIKLLGLLFAGTITFILLYGAIMTYLTILLSSRFGASSFAIGMMITAMSITTAIVSSQLGKISEIFSLGTLILGAFICYGIAFSLVPMMKNMLLLLIPIAIVGMGQGVNIPSIQTAVAGMAPLEYRAAFMSANAMMLRLGQTLGPALMALVYAGSRLDLVFYVSSGLAFATVAVILGYRIFSRKR